MRGLVKLVRKFIDSLDKNLVYSLGKEIYYYEVVDTGERNEGTYVEDKPKAWMSVPVLLFGICDIIGDSGFSVFGIDAPDEIVISCNCRAIMKALGGYPKVGSKLKIGADEWMIINRRTIDHRIWGDFRLELVCQRYVVNVTAGSKCA